MFGFLESIFKKEFRKTEIGDSVLINTGGNDIVICGGTLNVYGQIIGNIVRDGAIEGPVAVNIIEGGSVEGDIVADVVVVAGEVKGNIVADQMVCVRNTGRIDGSATASSLTVAVGGIINGEIKHLNE